MRMSELLNEVRRFSLDEGFSPKEIKMAIGIASDPRYAKGNMTGAVTAIERMKKGLSDHPQVVAVLKRQNEDLQNEVFGKQNYDYFDDKKKAQEFAKKNGGKVVTQTGKRGADYVVISVKEGLDEEKDFPHMMYDPKTGQSYEAKTMEDHLRMKKLGYSHTTPKDEAVSMAQQAAIAISKKERGEKPKEEGNTFGKELKSARDKGEKTFVVSGKKYNVEDYDIDEAKKKPVSQMTPKEKEADAARRKEYKAYQKSKRNEEEVEIDESMKMTDPKLLKMFDKLKSKDTVKIKYDSTLEKGTDFIEFTVKSKGTVRNGQVEKITLAAKGNPTGAKRFMYKKDGKVTFATGDMAASIVDIKESIKRALLKLESVEVNEMAYKPGSFKDTKPQEKGAKALTDLAKDGGMDKKDFEKVRALYVQSSDVNSRKKLRNFIQDLDTSPAEAVMDAIGRNDPDTFEKMYPDAKSGEFLSKISFRHRKIKNEEVELGEKYDLYHKDFSDAMQHAYSYAKSKMGITVDPKEIDNKVATGPKKPSEGKTNTYKLKGKGGNLQIQVYNKGGSKPFELNMYKEENALIPESNDLISQAAQHISHMQMSEKVDSADVDDDASQKDVDDAGKNIIMQLRKSVSMRGNKDVEFSSDKQKVDMKIAQKALDMYNKMKPQDKTKFQTTIAKSYKDLLNAIKGK